MSQIRVSPQSSHQHILFDSVNLKRPPVAHGVNICSVALGGTLGGCVIFWKQHLARRNRLIRAGLRRCYLTPGACCLLCHEQLLVATRSPHHPILTMYKGPAKQLQSEMLWKHEPNQTFLPLSCFLFCFLFNVCGQFACRYVCVLSAHLVDEETKSGCRVPWNWRFRWLWTAT